MILIICIYECAVVVSARWAGVSISETTNLGFSQIAVSEFKENGPKKKKVSREKQFSG